MKSTRQLLTHACREAGARPPFWTQGAGGNVSLKSDDTLFVKASGLRLDEVREDRGIATVAIADLLTRLDTVTSEEEYAAALRAHSGERPSMETGFHAILPGQWVVHLHSLAAVLMAHERRLAPEKVTSWLEAHSPFSFAFLPALRPGWELSHAARAHRETQMLVLESHGIILQSAESPLAAWRDLEASYCRDRGFDLGAASPGPCPLKIYFPDTAVFLDRIRKILTPAGDGTFSLHPDAALVDRDAAEIFLATQILYREAPALEELPIEISATLAQLPTEIFRRKAAARSERKG